MMKYIESFINDINVPIDENNVANKAAGIGTYLVFTLVFFAL